MARTYARTDARTFASAFTVSLDRTLVRALSTKGARMSARGRGESGVSTAQAEWRKSQRSNPDGNCVELAVLDSGEIAVRNSRDAGGPILVYTPAEIIAFIQGAKDGEFDDLLS